MGNVARLLGEAFLLTRLELRLAHQQARAWLFVVAMVACAVLAYVVYTRTHLAAFSPNAGLLGPQYLVGSLGTHFLLLLSFGVGLVALDAVHRNRQARIEDVFDAKPLSGIAVAAGRVIGWTLAIWLPAVCLGLLLQVLGMVAEAHHWPFGGRMQIHSLLALLFLALPPSLLLVGATVNYVATTTRSRAATALLLVPLSVVAYWGVLSRPPAAAAAVVDGVVNHGISSVSGVVTAIVDWDFIAGRAICLLVAAGLVALAAARLRSASPRCTVRVGVALLAAATVGIVALASSEARRTMRLDAWAEAHRNAADADGYELASLAGEVVIEPGERMAIDVQLEVVPKHAQETPRSLLTLNPGLKVLEVLVGRRPVSFTHERGLLRVSLPQGVRGRAFSLSVRAVGMPDPDFVHLGMDRERLPALPNGQPFYGGAAIVFERQYVALMPGAFWLPAIGSAMSPPDEGRGKDFAKVALTVDVPRGWTVALPGVRSTVAAEDGRARFRFDPQPPVAGVGLFASDFAGGSVVVDDVEFELLLAPRHMANARLYADALPNLVSRLGYYLAESRRQGLEYPFGAMRFVEVPQALRLHGDGWLLDSRHSLPGLHLVSETGFPTAPFERRLAALRAGEHGEAVESRVDALHAYLEGDDAGASPLIGLRRNLLAQHIDTTGTGAESVRFVVAALVGFLLGEQPEWYSARVPSSQMVASVGTRLLQAMADLGLAADRSEFASPHVQLLGGPALVDLGEEPAEDAILLYQRGSAIARTIFDDLGTLGTKTLLGDVSRLKYGGSFDADAFETIAERHIGGKFRAMTSGWVHSGESPGFSVSSPRVRRLAEPTRDGFVRHAMLVDIHNDQPVGGALRIAYADGDGLAYSDVVTVDAGRSVKVGLETKLPMSFGWVAPYMALNRSEIHLEEVHLDPSAPPVPDSVLGVATSDWVPRRAPGIIVDDLGTGFSVAHEGQPTVLAKLLSLSAASQTAPDEGTVLKPATDRWRRVDLATAWGSEHRRTVTDIRAGNGRARAVFEASLPSAGRWRLAYHMPELVGEMMSTNSRSFGRRTEHGDYELLVSALDAPEGEGVCVTFDAASAAKGWNRVGSFSLRAGRIRVAVSSRSTGAVVYADAIRWTRADV